MYKLYSLRGISDYVAPPHIIITNEMFEIYIYICVFKMPIPKVLPSYTIHLIYDFIYFVWTCIFAVWNKFYCTIQSSIEYICKINGELLVHNLMRKLMEKLVQLFLFLYNNIFYVLKMMRFGFCDRKITFIFSNVCDCFLAKYIFF